mmetsp:Transcript_32088/g.69300  ORF Transcript_32088/g.69300 Transcript_32088/m.69300 type:complete len:357 (-) Transcript_32088:146-1216(-)
MDPQTVLPWLQTIDRDRLRTLSVGVVDVEVGNRGCALAATMARTPVDLATTGRCQMHVQIRNAAVPGQNQTDLSGGHGWVHEDASTAGAAFADGDSPLEAHEARGCAPQCVLPRLQAAGVGSKARNADVCHHTTMPQRLQGHATQTTPVHDVDDTTVNAARSHGWCATTAKETWAPTAAALTARTAVTPSSPKAGRSTTTGSPRAATGTMGSTTTTSSTWSTLAVGTMRTLNSGCSWGTIGTGHALRAVWTLGSDTTKRSTLAKSTPRTSGSDWALLTWPTGQSLSPDGGHADFNRGSSHANHFLLETTNDVQKLIPSLLKFLKFCNFSRSQGWLWHPEAKAQATRPGLTQIRIEK